MERSVEYLHVLRIYIQVSLPYIENMAQSNSIRSLHHRS